MDSDFRSGAQRCIKKLGCEDISIDELLMPLGVVNGTADIDGMLCQGTYEQIGAAVYDVLKTHGCAAERDRVIKMVTDAYCANADDGEVKPTCDNIRAVLERLKKDGRRLLVVTTDNYEVTDKCLCKLGINDIFDKIYTDDGATPVKPDPTCIVEYCKSTGTRLDKVVMVGDTMTDVKFAKNAGFAVIGVGATENYRERLRPCADAVISDVSHILM